MKGRKIYAMYRGDELILVGTSDEVMKKLDLSLGTFRAYVSSAHQKKVKDSGLVGYVVMLEKGEILE